MRPVLLRTGPLVVPAYPLLLYVAIVTGLILQNESARSAGLDTTAVFAASVATAIAGIACTKLWYLGEHGEPLRAWRQSGMTLTGGLIGGLATFAAVALLLDLPTARVLDLSVPGLLAGLAIARVGCWLNGCCAGRVTASRWGLRSPDHTGRWERRVPTQPLEGLWALALLSAALATPDLAGAGATFALFFGLYLAGRQLLLPYRAARTRT